MPRKCWKKFENSRILRIWNFFSICNNKYVNLASPLPPSIPSANPMTLFCKGKAFLSAAIKPRNIKFIFWVTWLICFVIWFHVQLPFFAHFKNCVITIHHHMISETEVEIFIRVYCELLTSLWKSSVCGGLVLLESPLVHHFSSLLGSPCGCLFTTAISWVEVALPKAYGACSPVVGLQWQYKRCWNCPSVETCL